MMFFRKQKKVRFLGLFIFYAICVFTTTVCSTSTQEVRIGALYPLSNVKSGAENLNGSQWLAGSLMAIHDLNERFANRNIVFKVAVRDTKRTFSNTIFGTFDLVERVFDKNGSHIIVGAGLNSLSEAIAYVLKDFEVAQIAYASNSTALSHPTLFPYFSRVYPSSSYESSAIADIISNYFDYSRVILIHSSDDYGLDGATQFALAAAKLKISIIATVKIEYFDSSTKSYIEMLSVYDVRVFVLIMSDVHQSGKLILQGSSTGIFSEETVIFSSGSLFTSELWMSLSTDASTISRIMSGLFVISNADDDWKVSPKGQNFIQRFRSLPDTKSLSANGSTVCNNKTDDDGSFYLYQFSVTGSPPYHCTGLSFKKFAADGSDISSFTAYSYDAMMAAGTAVIKYADVYNGGIIPHKINGALLSNFIKSHISVMGYTGYIDFNNGTSGDQFDAGTRKTSVRFKVNNFNIGAGTLKDFALRRVGTWTTEGGFELCGADLTLQSAITGGCTSIRYGTSDNSKPAGQPVTIIEIMPYSMNVTLYSLATINFLVILLIGFILVVYRNTRLLKASQSSMMWIIVSANIFSVIRTVLASSAPTAGICTASTWMGHLGWFNTQILIDRTGTLFNLFLISI